MQAGSVIIMASEALTTCTVPFVARLDAGKSVLVSVLLNFALLAMAGGESGGACESMLVTEVVRHCSVSVVPSTRFCAPMLPGPCC